MTQKTFESLLSFLFFVFALLAVFGILIHEKTIIDWRIPCLVALAGSAIVTALFWNIMKKRGIKWGVRSFFCLGYGAAGFYFGLFFLNYVFAHEPTLTESFAIESRELKYGKFGKSTSVIINFNGITHELKFPKSDWPNVQQVDSVGVTYSKGLFGFPLVGSYEYEMILPYPLRKH